jgi:hypothetical protein
MAWHDVFPIKNHFDPLGQRPVQGPTIDGLGSGSDSVFACFGGEIRQEPANFFTPKCKNRTATLT